MLWLITDKYAVECILIMIKFGDIFEKWHPEFVINFHTRATLIF